MGDAENCAPAFLPAVSTSLGGCEGRREVNVTEVLSKLRHVDLTQAALSL